MRRLILAGLAGTMLASLPLATASAQWVWRGPGWYGGHYYYRYWGDDGAAVGLGFAAGALTAGAIAASAPPPPPAVAPVYLYPPNTRLGYCERQLPGFDAATGTYIAPNGRRVRCP